jgi:hypothetical protein
MKRAADSNAPVNATKVARPDRSPFFSPPRDPDATDSEMDATHHSSLSEAFGAAAGADDETLGGSGLSIGAKSFVGSASGYISLSDDSEDNSDADDAEEEEEDEEDEEDEEEQDDDDDDDDDEDDDDDDDDDDDEEDEDDEPLASPPTQTTQARLAQFLDNPNRGRLDIRQPAADVEDLTGDSPPAQGGARRSSSSSTNEEDEDDESLFESDAAKRQRRQREASRRGRAAAAAGHGGDRRPRLQRARDLDPALSAAQRDALRLDQLKKPEDQNLMRLFWAHGWTPPAAETDLDMKTARCFVFLAHQFEALRFVAGVPKDWPQKYPPQDWPSASLDGNMHGGNPWKPGGGILGDMMGLGKTIELLGGAFLREILHAHHGFPDRTRTTMIVLPNDPVCDQWKAAAIKAGIPANHIAVYTGNPKAGVLPDANRRFASMASRFTLTTIHRLQADAIQGKYVRPQRSRLLTQSDPVGLTCTGTHVWSVPSQLSRRGRSATALLASRTSRARLHCS